MTASVYFHPAPCDPDLALSLSGQLVVCLVSVRYQTAAEFPEKFHRVIRLACLLIFVNDDRLFLKGIAPIDPHVALCSGISAIFRHEKRRLIRMDHRMGKHLIFQPLIEQRKISLRCFDDPSGHVLTGYGNIVANELLLHPVKGRRIDVFAVHDPGQKRRRRDTAPEKLRRVVRSDDAVLLLPTVDLYVMFHRHILCGDELHICIYFVRKAVPSVREFLFETFL